MSIVNKDEFAFRLIYKRETGLQYVAMIDMIEYIKTIRDGMTTPEIREVLGDIITNLATIRIEKQS